MQPILLDTCAAIWIAEDEKLEPEAVELLDAAGETSAPIYLSPISAWEVGLLASRERLRLQITPQRWFARLLELPNMRLAELSPDVLIESSFLPGKPPRDPADRILAATARAHGATLITRDRSLLAYGEQGHIRVVEC
jgi:PIN domain nuclease of toxin-antitoxin system